MWYRGHLCLAVTKFQPTTSAPLNLSLQKFMMVPSISSLVSPIIMALSTHNVMRRHTDRCSFMCILFQKAERCSPCPRRGRLAEVCIGTALDCQINRYHRRTPCPDAWRFPPHVSRSGIALMSNWYITPFLIVANVMQLRVVSSRIAVSVFMVSVVNIRQQWICIHVFYFVVLVHYC